MNATNSYAVAAKRKTMLAVTGKLDTKSNLLNTGIETVKDVVAGAVLGGLVGAYVGRPAAFIGLGITAGGHYLGSSLASSFGLSMMTMGGYKLASGVDGVEGLDGGKERVKQFLGNWKHSLYLDKLKLKKAPATNSEGTNGLGNVQYFKYPSNELDMSGLENLEQEINRSGEQYERQRQFAGTYEDVSGIEERII